MKYNKNLNIKEKYKLLISINITYKYFKSLKNKINKRLKIRKKKELLIIMLCLLIWLAFISPFFSFKGNAMMKKKMEKIATGNGWGRQAFVFRRRERRDCRWGPLWYLVGISGIPRGLRHLITALNLIPRGSHTHTQRPKKKKKKNQSPFDYDPSRYGPSAVPPTPPGLALQSFG